MIFFSFIWIALVWCGVLNIFLSFVYPFPRSVITYYPSLPSAMGATCTDKIFFLRLDWTYHGSEFGPKLQYKLSHLQNTIR